MLKIVIISKLFNVMPPKKTVKNDAPVESHSIKEEKPKELKKETKTKTKKEVKETKKTKSKKESSISISDSEDKYLETSIDSLS